MDPMVVLELPPHHLTSVLPILYAQLLRSETDPDYVGHSTASSLRPCVRTTFSHTRFPACDQNEDHVEYQFRWPYGLR